MLAGLKTHVDPTGSIAGLSSAAWTKSPDGTRLKGNRDGMPPTGSPDGTRPGRTGNTGRMGSVMSRAGRAGPSGGTGGWERTGRLTPT